MEPAGAHLLGRLVEAAASGEDVPLQAGQGVVRLHSELDAEPPLGLLQHRRIGQALLGAGRQSTGLLVVMGAGDRGGGQVGQELGQLHVELIELGRCDVEQPDAPDVLVDVAQRKAVDGRHAAGHRLGREARDPLHGGRGAEIGDQDPLAGACRLQAGALAQLAVQGGHPPPDGVAGGHEPQIPVQLVHDHGPAAADRQHPGELGTQAFQGVRDLIGDHKRPRQLAEHVAQPVLDHGQPQ